MRTIYGLLLLASCGQPSEEKPPPPTVELACDRGVSCGIVIEEDWGYCVACLNFIKEEIEKAPTTSVSCAQLASYARAVRAADCIEGHWYPPVERLPL